MTPRIVSVRPIVIESQSEQRHLLLPWSDGLHRQCVQLIGVSALAMSRSRQALSSSQADSSAHRCVPHAVRHLARAQTRGNQKRDRAGANRTCGRRKMSEDGRRAAGAMTRCHHGCHLLVCLYYQCCHLKLASHELLRFYGRSLV